MLVYFVRYAIRACSLELFEAVTCIEDLSVRDVSKIKCICWVATMYASRRCRRWHWKEGFIEDFTLLLALVCGLYQTRSAYGRDTASTSVIGASTYVLAYGPYGLHVGLGDPGVPVVFLRLSNAVAVAVAESPVIFVRGVVRIV